MAIQALRRARVALAAGAASLALVAPVPGSAEPAAPSVTAHGGVQVGRPLHTTSESFRDNGICVRRFADYVGGYPSPIVHNGTSLEWRVPDPRYPSSVSVSLWRAGTQHTPIGTRETVDVTLAPDLARGRIVGWRLTSPPVRYGDLHLEVHLEWPGACGGTDSAGYSYRLLSVPTPDPS